jgi:hypothetical protein
LEAGVNDIPPGTPLMVIERLLDVLSVNEIEPVSFLPAVPTREDAVIVGPATAIVTV